MKIKRRALLLCLFFAFAPQLFAPRIIAATTPYVLLTDAAGISGFELYGNGLYWWSSRGVCGTEFPHTATIRVRGVTYSSTKFLETDCAILQGYDDNAIRDDAYAYFFSNGQLMRKPLSAALADPPQTLVTSNFNPTLPAGQLGSALYYANGTLYWSRYANGLADLYSMPADGSAAPKYFLTIIGGAEVQKMRLIQFTDSGTTINGMVILLSNGKLYRYKFNASGTLNQIGTGVSDFAVHHVSSILSVSATIYATTGQSGLVAQGAPAGQLFKIDAATASSSVIYTAQSNNQLLSVATDSDDSVFIFGGGSSGPKNVYVAEAAVTCDLFCSTGDISIHRHTLPGSTTGWAQILSTGGGVNLRSDDNQLYFTLTNSIQRISTDAPAQLLDIQADAVEVVQVIQDLNSSMTLVANRPTYVRAYAHLATNTTGIPQWFPSAKLHGFRNGTEMAGSPIEPINNPVVDKTNDLGVVRSDMTHCFLFELPSDWVAPPTTLPFIDQLTFQFTVNPDLGIAETPATPLANNTVTSASASIIKKGYPCVVTIPVYTTGPTYWPDNPNFGPNMERARSLMPIEDLSVFAFAATEPVGDPDDPFDMLDPNSDNRSDTADDILDAVEDVDLDSDPCDDKDDVHYVGTLHKDSLILPGVFGDSYRNDPNCWITMFDKAVSGHAPGGGEDMAHEFGHNYGRKHIQCGSFPSDQANFDFVPFPATLGFPSRETTAAPFGFDTITLTVIPPDAACDTMSYGSTKWSSIWYWSALLGQTAFGALPELQLAPAAAARVALISGNIFVSNSVAVLRPFKILPAGSVPPKKLARSRTESRIASDDANPVKVAFLDDKGAVLATIPIKSKDSSNHNETRGERIHFGQYVDFPEGARTIRFIQGTTIFGERFISDNAPRLQLDQPVIDATAATLALTWSADDPDGDPLRFTVQYSSDNGLHWMSLKSNWKPMGFSMSTRLLPGGTQCLLRVTASDGANATIATTAPFTIAEHAPEVYITGIVEGERIAYGDNRVLRAHALDAETPMQNITFAWEIIGATSMTSTSIVVNLHTLSPGPYTVKLTATDAQGQSASQSKHFEVLPIMIPTGATPILDGTPGDPGYADAAFARIPLGNNEFANVRMLHSNGSLFVSFSGLKLPSGRVTSRRAGIRIATTGVIGATPDQSDVGFFVDWTGIPSQEIGNGTTMAVTPSPKAGFSAAVQQSATTWSAELRISETLIGGWDHVATIMLDHDTPHWPPNAADSAPNTWAPAYFGTTFPAVADRAPVANAGSPQRTYVRAPRMLWLDGTSSFDPDGGDLRYSWTQLSGPTVTLQNSDSATPSFLAPVPTDVTTLTFQLTVTDFGGLTGQGTTTVTLLPAIRLPRPPAQDGFASFQSDGALNLRLVGSPQQIYRIEASQDFVTWQTVKTVSADFSGRIDTTQIVDFAGQNYLFFRAVSP